MAMDCEGLLRRATKTSAAAAHNPANSSRLSAVLDSLLVASRFHENPPHGLGGRREKMTAAVPRSLVLRFDQAKIRFVDECRGLERVASCFAASRAAASFLSSS